MSTMKFDIEKFDENNSFNLWQVQMFSNLKQNGLKKALLGKTKKLTGMNDEDWDDLDYKDLSAI